MPSKNPTPVHPGVVLSEKYLKPLGQSQAALARHLGVPSRRINEIVRGKRAVTPETAWLLAQAFDNNPQYWIRLQVDYDVARTRPRGKRKIANINLEENWPENWPD